MYLWQCILKIHVYMYYAKAWKYVFKNIRESLYKLKDKTCPCTRQRGGWWWCWFSPNWLMCSIAFHKYSDYFFFSWYQLSWFYNKGTEGKNKQDTSYSGFPTLESKFQVFASCRPNPLFLEGIFLGEGEACSPNRFHFLCIPEDLRSVH